MFEIFDNCCYHDFTKLFDAFFWFHTSKQIFPWPSANMMWPLNYYFLGFMSNIMCCTEGYYFPLNIISSISIPYTAEPLLGLEFFTDRVSVCSGISSFFGSLSASYISSSCTSSVSYFFIFLLVYSDSCSTLLSSSTTVFPSSSSTHCGPFKRFVSSVFFSSSSYL